MSLSLHPASVCARLLQGRLQAMRAGALLRAYGFAFDEAHTSVLRRAIRTLHLVEEQMGLLHLPEAKAWQLNERHYGALQVCLRGQAAAEVACPPAVAQARGALCGDASPATPSGLPGCWTPR